MTVLLWALGILAGGLLVAALRSSVEDALRAVLGVPAAVLVAVSDGLGRVVGHLAAGAEHTWDALAYGDDEKAQRTTIWDALTPVVYLGLFLVLLSGDIVLASLRFSALIGVEIAQLPVSGTTLDVLSGVLFVGVLATMGATWLDVNHVTPLRRPYGLLVGSMRTTVRFIAAAGTALSAVAGLMFLVWGQGALGGAPSSDLATLFVALFGTLLVTASVLAFGGAVPVVSVAALVTLLALGAVLAVVQWLADAVVSLLAAVHRLLVHLLRILSRPGELLWSWTAGRAFGGKLGLEPLQSSREELTPIPSIVVHEPSPFGTSDRARRLGA